MSGKTLLDLNEVAEELGLNIYMIKTLVKKGKLKAEKLTNKYFIHIDEIKRFVEKTREQMVQK